MSAHGRGLGAVATGLTGAALLLVLVLVASTGARIGVVVLVLTSGAVITLVAGPERAGAGALLAAAFTAPLNALRVLPWASAITVSDLFFAAGFVLLLPRLARARPQLPALYRWGVVLLLMAGLGSSVAAPATVTSLAVFLRLVVAAIALPFALAAWSPTRPLVQAYAAAYVAGQVVNTVSAALDPTGGAYVRAIGLTTHPNFLGLGGQIGLALCLMLAVEVPRRWRWLVWLAGLTMVYSVLLSGSRASLLACGLLLVVSPLVERRASRWYAVLAAAPALYLSAGYLISRAPAGSAIGRLTGQGSAVGSDEERATRLGEGLHQFMGHPLTGSGWTDDLLLIHSAYVQVGVAGGVLALLAWLLVGLSLVRPLFLPRPNRAAYAALSFFSVSLIDPFLWERIGWAALALVFAAQTGRTTSSGPDEEPSPEHLAPATTRRAHGPHLAAARRTT